MAKSRSFLIEADLKYRFCSSNSNELELIQSRMAQKPVLRGEVGCACVAREVSVERGGMDELELIQSHMAQKPVLRGEVDGRARSNDICSNSGCARLGSGVVPPLGVVEKKMAVLIALIRRHRCAVGAVVRRVVDDEVPGLDYLLFGLVWIESTHCRYSTLLY